MASYTYGKALYRSDGTMTGSYKPRKLDWMKNLNVERECVQNHKIQNQSQEDL